MEVVLLQDVEKLGARGDIVSVSRGYMRNYLEPRRLAQVATPRLVSELRRRDELRARQEARTLEQARAIAEQLTKTVLRFEVRAGAQGILFGSITASDVADELWRVRRVRIDRRKVRLEEPIKRVGRYDVPVEVFQDVIVQVKTLVVPQGGSPELEEEAEDAAEDAGGEALDSEGPNGEDPAA